jgi:hypothetical protein
MVFFSIVCVISTCDIPTKRDVRYSYKKFLCDIPTRKFLCDIPTKFFCAIFLHEFSVRYSYTNFLCDIPTQIFCVIFLHEFSVQYFYTNFQRYTNFNFDILHIFSVRYSLVLQSRSIFMWLRLRETMLMRPHLLWVRFPFHPLTLHSKPTFLKQTKS